MNKLKPAFPCSKVPENGKWSEDNKNRPEIGYFSCLSSLLAV